MDINDFDETVLGPWEWDLKRLAASLVLAGREGEAGEKHAAKDAVKSYRRIVRELAGLPFLRSWNALPDASALNRAKADELIDDFDKAAAKARKNTSAKIARKRTQEYDDEATGLRRLRFIEDPPTRTHVDESTAEQVIDALESYVDTLRESRRNPITRYSVSDVAFRVVGTGQRRAPVLRRPAARQRRPGASCTEPGWCRPSPTSCSAGPASTAGRSSSGSSVT